MTHANNRRGAFVYNRYDYFIKRGFLQAERVKHSYVSFDENDWHLSRARAWSGATA